MIFEKLDHKIWIGNEEEQKKFRNERITARLLVFSIIDSIIQTKSIIDCVTFNFDLLTTLKDFEKLNLC